MKGAPLTKHEALDRIQVIINTVDRRAKELEIRWGIGRLATLVPVEIALKFRSQQRKFSAAIWEYEPELATKHGEAMLRAYDALDAMATAAHGEPAPPDQWEFETDQGLVVLVRDSADIDRAQFHGRKAQVWSLEEVASIVRAHPVLVASKISFPGAVVESVRPYSADLNALNDEVPI